MGALTAYCANDNIVSMAKFKIEAWERIKKAQVGMPGDERAWEQTLEYWIGWRRMGSLIN
jgi:hypothetical protein